MSYQPPLTKVGTFTRPTTRYGERSRYQSLSYALSESRGAAVITSAEMFSPGIAREASTMTASSGSLTA
jgi:hypothetical protein